MFLWELIKANPVAGCSLLATLATLFWCLRLVRRVHTKMERYMMGILGLIAMYQGLHILETTGFWSWPPKFQGIGGAVDMTVAAMCLVCALILQVASADRHNTKLQLRVVEANQAPRLVNGLPYFPERAALAVFGVDASGTVNLWHDTCEKFFGWKRSEVLGTRLPFRDGIPGSSVVVAPLVLKLRTRQEEQVDVLAWFVPVPGGTGSLVMVLDWRKTKSGENTHIAAAASLSSPELSVT